MRGVATRPAPADRPVRSSPGRVPLLAFVADAESKRVLDEVCAHPALSGGEVIRGGIAKAIEHLAVERSPAILVVDISGVDLPVSQLHNLADVCEPGVSVIAIGERNEIGLYRDLLHAGVSDYIVKPLTAQLLQRPLRLQGEAGEAAPLSHRLGKLLALVGARGGVGTSAIAANLAWLLAHQQNRRVALVDLDLQNGDCALSLNVQPNSGLRDALVNPQRIDPTLVDRVMTRVGERLFVLSSVEPIEDEVAFTGDAVAALVGVLRAEFHYVIVDVPRFATRQYRRAIDLADLRVIVADQTLRSARDTARLRASFGDVTAPHRDLYVINRGGEGGRHAVTVDEIGTTLGLRPKCVIPYLPHLFAQSAMRGEVPAARAGKFADAIGALAAELTGRQPPRRWFGR